MPVNNFNANRITIGDLAFPANPGNDGTMPVIEALAGQLITTKLHLPPKIVSGHVVSDPGNDILKLVVVNRYHNAPVAKALIRNIGIHRGAIASSVAHDSHNIVAVGVDDECLLRAINIIIGAEGGISCVDIIRGSDLYEERILPLPVAGLMSASDGYEVAERYTSLDAMAKSLGSTLEAPFMTLSFMALLVIPHIKLSDKGLFDGDLFSFYPR